jgi:hypothetical protein
MTNTIDQHLEKLASLKDHSAVRLNALRRRYEKKFEEINLFFDQVIGEIELRRGELQIELSTLHHTESTTLQQAESDLLKLQRRSESLLRECRSFDLSSQRQHGELEISLKRSNKEEDRPPKKMKKQEKPEEIEKESGSQFQEWLDIGDLRSRFLQIQLQFEAISEKTQSESHGLSENMILEFDHLSSQEWRPSELGRVYNSFEAQVS